MSVVGRHLVADLFGCPAAVLDDAQRLVDVLVQSVESAGMQVLHTHFHAFEPQGVTGVVVLSTSHISVHTWPEHGYAALDLFTCGGGDPWLPLRSVVRALAATRTNVFELERGNPAAQPGTVHTIRDGEAGAMRGDAEDAAELQELLAGPHRILYNGASQYQDVLVVESDQDIRMYLDGQLQFSSADERWYHEALVHPAMVSVSMRSRVLILGGGDGLALREVLKYPDVRHVDLVDLDPVVLGLARHLPPVLAMNDRALHDRRVKVHPRDAKGFVDGHRRPYDVIIIDFPDPADEVIAGLYTREFLQKVARLLAADGLLVCQSHSPEDAPMVYWSIGLTLEEAGLQTLSYHLEVPSFGDWGFHLAGRRQPVWQSLPVPVPCQTMPVDLSEWFAFGQEILDVRSEVEPNSQKNLVLHEYYDEEVGPD